MMKTVTFSSVLALAVATAAPAFAQAAASTANDGANGPADIVVTAERREVSVQKTPISVTAVSAEELNKRGITRLEDLTAASPSLAVQDNGLIKLVNIRGIGLQVVQPTTSSGVAYHIDGVFIPKEVSLLEPYYDLERMEVLRGPQGTLAGQNATGGAIFAVSRKPTLDGITGTIQAELGEFKKRSAQGAVNTPLGNSLALRTAVFFSQQDSFTTNTFTPLNNAQVARHPGNDHSVAAKTSLLFQPSDTFSAVLRYSFYSKRSDGTAQKPIAEADKNPWHISYNTDNRFDTDINRVSAEMKWEVSDNLSVRSLTGYHHQKITIQTDNDKSVNDDSAVAQTVVDKAFEQELNLVGSGDRFNWVLGMFYMHDQTPVALDIGYHVSNPGAGGFPIIINPDHKSFAVFGQGSYKLTDGLELVAGARYNRDKKVSNGRLGPFVTAANFINSAPTGKIGLNWQATPLVMVYASASRGYKAGGIDAGGAVSAPEKVDAYEVGVKSRLFDRRLVANFAAFQYNYKNFQLPVYDPSIQQTLTRNIATSTIRGFEGNLDYSFGALSLDASFGYLDSKIGSGVKLVDPRQSATTAIDVSGRQLNNAPKWTLSLGASYDIPLAGGKLTPSVRYNYKSSYFLSPFQQPVVDNIPKTSSVDVRLRFTSERKWWIEGYGTNIGNRLNVADLGSFGGGYYVTYAPPRQLGFRFGADF